MNQDWMRAHWKGELPLGRSFWLMYGVGSVVSYLLLWWMMMWLVYVGLSLQIATPLAYAGGGAAFIWCWWGAMGAALRRRGVWGFAAIGWLLLHMGLVLGLIFSTPMRA